MRAIILVAGKGTRLRPLTESVPKCFTEVGGTPILLNALDQLESCGIRRVTLVVGYLGNYIRERVGARRGELGIDYVVNELYDRTNTGCSLLWALREHPVGEAVTVLEGDVFFERELLAQFLAAGTPNATVVEQYRPPLDGSFVALEGEQVVDWIHTSERGADFTIEDKFKTVNIHRFAPEFIQQALLPVLERRVAREGGHEPLEYVMGEIVRADPAAVSAFQADGLRWFEIDDVEDLRVAEELFASPSP